MTDRNIPPGTPMWGEIERTAREARARECEFIHSHLVENNQIDMHGAASDWLARRQAAIRAGKA